MPSPTSSRRAALIALIALVGLSVPTTAQAAARTDCRPVPTPAADILRASDVWSMFGVDGSGVRVGVISDSFGTAGEDVVAADVAAGWLPGPGNPCGWTTPTRVVLENSTSASDEGRAMAQLVHGIAPGAELMFAAPPTSDNAGLAVAIDALRDAGADIIVDDLAADDDLAYERLAAGYAVQRAVDAGVLYVSAAGNFGRPGAEGYPSAGYPVSGWSSSRYRPMPCAADVEQSALASAPEITAVDCMDVDPGPGSDPGLGVTLLPGFATLSNLHWAQKAGSVTTHLGLGVKNLSTGELKVVWASDPERPLVPSALSGLGSADPTEWEVSIVRRVTPEASTPAVSIVMPNVVRFLAVAALEYFHSTETDDIGASLIGHEADPATLAVAAVNASDLTLGTYSSAGPATTLFGVPTATTVPGPALAGVDGLPVSLPMDGEENLFFGTSAAAPTVAAVAALAVQAAPGTTPAALRDALVGGARADAFASPWPSTLDASRFSGAGLTDAVATVAAVLPPAPTPTPTPVPTSVPTPTAVPAPDPTAAPAAASPPGRLAESGTSIDGVALGTGVLSLIAGLVVVRARTRRRNGSDAAVTGRR